ncbi:MAG TPA: MFS transporter [Blastocatellia bacterium]
MDAELTAALPQAETGFRVTEAYRYYVAWLLCGVYLLNQADRQIFAVLQQPIKETFAFSDAQLGLIGGTAFALFYATLAIPIARLADRTHRVNIIAVSLALWSLFTAITGMAANFWQMLGARLVVGVGEAGCSPPSYSVISDYFESKRRATAIGIYSLGLSGGSILGLLVGSKIAEAHGWRSAFYVMGLPGILLALIVRLTLREPPRGLSDNAPVAGQAPVVRRVLAGLWDKRSFRRLSVAASLYAIAANGIGSFYAVFLMRSHTMRLAEAGGWLALASIGGLAGAFLGGKIADLLANRKGDARWLMWIPAVALTANLPVGFFLYTADGKTWVIVLLMINITLSGAYLAPTVATTQRLVGPRERALASAILFFLMSLVGLGLGPILTGYLSDAFKRHFISLGRSAAVASGDGLRMAFICMLVTPLLAVVFYISAARKVREELLS